jgi:hypothetical protein
MVRKKMRGRMDERQTIELSRAIQNQWGVVAGKKKKKKSKKSPRTGQRALRNFSESLRFAVRMI